MEEAKDATIDKAKDVLDQHYAAGFEDFCQEVMEAFPNVDFSKIKPTPRQCLRVTSFYSHLQKLFISSSFHGIRCFGSFYFFAKYISFVHDLDLLLTGLQTLVVYPYFLFKTSFICIYLHPWYEQIMFKGFFWTLVIHPYCLFKTIFCMFVCPWFGLCLRVLNVGCSSIFFI